MYRCLDCNRDRVRKYRSELRGALHVSPEEFHGTLQVFTVEQANEEIARQRTGRKRKVKVQHTLANYLLKEGGPYANMNVRKAGETTNIFERVQQLQTGNPRPLLIDKIYSAEPGLEGRLHTMLAALRESGEWFWYVNEMRSLFEPMPGYDVAELSVQMEALRK
jgi:hypothetical protein